MPFDVGSVVAHVKADTTNFSKGISDAKEQVSGFKDGINGLNSIFGKFVALAGAYIGTQQLVGFLKSSSEEANNFAKSMTTLEIISGRFGVRAEEAQNAAKNLGKELRIGVGPAAESLQNLLKSGLNLDQSVDLLKRFTNEAITGKSSSITLSQAVQNLSFAYATNNSAIGNLSGINENFVNITEKGRESLIKKGMATEKITDDMAKYEGMINLTNLTMGSSEKFTGTLIDKQAQLDQKMLDLKISIGMMLNPVLAILVDNLSKLVDWINLTLIPMAQMVMKSEEWNTAIQWMGDKVVWFKDAILIPFITYFNEVLWPQISAFIELWKSEWDILSERYRNTWQIIWGIVQVAFSLIYAFVNTMLSLTRGDWESAWNGIKWATQLAWDGIKNIFGGIISYISGWGSQLVHNLVQPFSDAWNKISEYVNKIKDALDFTKRHSPSVVDIVTRGVSLVNKAMDGLEWNTTVTPHAALAVGANNVAGGNMINQITISLDGAMISDEQGASRIAEIVGNNIIKKLQANVRF